MNTKNRLYGLDVLRIFSALMVFLFHSNIHLGCNYGMLTPFIARGDIFMVMFFMISGFSLYYNYCERELLKLVDICDFYIKRIISVYPLYIVIYMLYLIFLNKLSFFKNILIAPYELLLMQSHFNSLFSILHNGGTWFVSCIVFAYFMYPFLQLLLKQIKKYKFRVVLLLYLICSMAPFVVYSFNISDVYSHPVFRTIEFFIGMIAASLYMDAEGFESQRRKKLCIGVGGISIISSFNFRVKQNGD